MYFRVSPYQELLEGINTALQFNEGILKVTGPAGTGKSAMCKQLFRQLDGKKQKVLFFVNPPKSAQALQTEIINFLGLQEGPNFTKALTNYLLAKAPEQRLLYLIIDDAQNLDEQTFNSLRMLCNVQDDHNALVRPVIFGNDSLDAKLSAANYRSVTQFLSQSFVLTAMNKEQLKNFFWTFWVSQGVEIQPPKDSLIASIFKQTHGLPGLVQDKLKHDLQHVPDSKQSAAAPVVRPPVTTLRPVNTRVENKSNKATERYLAGFFAVLVLTIGGFMYYLNLKVDAQPPRMGSAAMSNPTPLAEIEAAVVIEPALEPEVQQQAASIVAEEAEAISVDQAEIPVSSDDQTIVQASNVEAEVSAVVESAEPEIAEPDLVEPEIAQIAEEAAEEVAAETVAAVEQETSSTSATNPAFPPELLALLEGWRSNWQQKDIDTYLSYYHPDFSSSSAENLVVWQSQRRSSIGRATEIELSYDMLDIVTADASNMTVHFWLRYMASSYGDDTYKELELSKVDGRWLIVTERNLQVERTR